MRLIPFNAVIPVAERDPMLGGKLQAEASGILTWAVVGCLLWQEEGLTAPTAVTAATDTYRAESDHVGNFVEDRLELGDDRQVTKADLYAAYVAWCRANDETAMGRDVLAKRLSARGLREGRTMHGRFMVGASLRRALSVVNGAMTQ
jgi:putative DNA primase/helicase